MSVNPSRLGISLLNFRIANPGIQDAVTAYNTWTWQDQDDYGFQKAQRALWAVRILNVLFRHTVEELATMLSIENQFTAHHSI